MPAAQRVNRAIREGDFEGFEGEQWNAEPSRDPDDRHLPSACEFVGARAAYAEPPTGGRDAQELRLAGSLSGHGREHPARQLACCEIDS